MTIADTEASETADADPWLLRTDRLGKDYPGVTALRDVSLDLRPGEVHAVVGENGAGKSTLIKLLAGAEAPTTGTLSVDGRTVSGLTPAEALELGIAVIYQEFTLVTTLSAADNVFLGDYRLRGPVLDRRSMHARAAELFERLGVSIDPRTPVEELTTGYQQVVEIAKALSKDARLLIMDEPSAPLTAAEVQAMYETIDALKSEGMTIVYISHRMDEIFRLADRVTVLRDGEHIATREIAETDRDELITLMVGRELTGGYPQRAAEPGDLSLRVEGLSGNGVEEVSFDAHRGEVLGFAGLIGAGRTELMELLFGRRPIESGRITFEGRRLHPRSPARAIADGVALVPEDRKRHGLILDFTIHENVSLPLLRRSARLGVPRADELELTTDHYMASLQIKSPDAHRTVTTLSGGNQQKVVLAKWLATRPEILIFDEPTRGIDVGARHEIYQLINHLADEGRTILMVSSDMEELIGMSDRVVVMGAGRVQGQLDGDDLTPETILTLASEGNGQ